MTDTATKPKAKLAKLGAEKLTPDDGLTQRERFEQAARALECDDDPERFKERVRKVAKARPIPDDAPPDQSL